MTHFEGTGRIMERDSGIIKFRSERAGVPAVTPRTGGTRSVFVRGRSLPQPSVVIPKGFARNERNKSDGLVLLESLEPEKYPLAFFDPQYRGVLDHQAYGNE